MARSDRIGTIRRPLAALALILALSLSACAPLMTDNRYAAGDGARGDLGEGTIAQVHVENLMVVSQAEGSPGTMLGGLANRSGEPVTVTFTVEGLGEAIDVEVPARTTVLLHPDHESVVLPSVPTPPGAVLPVQISTTASGSITIPAPVLDGRIDPYQDFLPSADDF